MQGFCKVFASILFYFIFYISVEELSNLLFSVVILDFHRLITTIRDVSCVYIAYVYFFNIVILARFV